MQESEGVRGKESKRFEEGREGCSCTQFLYLRKAPCLELIEHQIDKAKEENLQDILYYITYITIYIQNKERVLKTTRRKMHVTYERELIRYHLIS